MSRVLAFPTVTECMIRNVEAWHAKLKAVEPIDSEKFVDDISINLHEAGLCAGEHIFTLKNGRNTCPKCGTTSWIRMSDVGLRPLNQAVLAALPVETPNA